jgi:hypothetical protein
MKHRYWKLTTWALGLAALSLFLLVAEAALISQTTALRKGPFSDAEAVAQLASGATVDILQRQGGWYEVKAGSQQGWVRMSSVHLGDGQQGGGSGLGGALGFLPSGRASATTTTPSTGVRGLDETELAKAEPDLGAVPRLEQFAVTDGDARQFAAQAPLTSANVQDLPGAAK